MSFWERYGCDIISTLLLIVVVIVLGWLAKEYVFPALGWTLFF